ncbi:flagellar biosynthetic protein FliR [Rhodospirillaceae bacterium SYSU D60014]|uniref:flagellar biosynthetic protein FliR n=1 Tax=Virgifigura deserti TaxID=2268457 RepID=UPI000E66B2B4
MLDQLLSAGVFEFLLVFARIGSAVMLLPGFGEAYVSPRIRLVLALLLSFVIMPLAAADLPPLPDALLQLFLLLAGEIVIGILLGTVTRLLLVGLLTAGMIIALQIGIANALANDPASAQQGSIIGNFLMALGVILIFATDLHHLMLRALIDSYSLFLPGVPLQLGDMAALITRIVSLSFVLSMQIAAPFILIGLIFYLGLGLLARLMPQVQVFFIAIPLQILLGMFVMMLGTSVAMLWFLQRFEGTLTGFLAPG